MLTRSFDESDTIKNSILPQNPNIAESLRLDFRCIFLVLRKNQHILGHQIYECLVPVIGMNMGNNHCINIEDLVHGNRQIDQRITFVTIDSTLESWNSSLFCQHWINQKFLPRIFDNDRWIRSCLNFMGNSSSTLSNQVYSRFAAYEHHIPVDKFA